MAFEALDWSIDRATGNIRYIGADHDGTIGSNGRTTPTYATVIEFHRALQDFADNASSSGDDELDITDENPSSRSTDNIITLLGSYNIDDLASEHLYDGSIIQAGGDEIYDGIVNFGNCPIIQVAQNGAIVADDWWNNDPQGNSLGLNSDPNGGISHRFMIKVRTGGADTDGRRLLGLSRQYGQSYAEFAISATSRGNNVFALSQSTDLNNATASGTVATFDTSLVTEGYALLDVDNNGSNEAYYTQWDLGTRTDINDLYEFVKYSTRDGTATTLYGLNGLLFRGVTHEVAYSSLAGGNFADSTVVTIGSSTAQILADNGTDKMYVQLLTGAAPASSDGITQGGVTATAGTVTPHTTESTGAPGLGKSTGSAIIGAYGVGVTPGDLGPNDQIFDLTNTQIFVPNNVSFSVSGLVATEDRVLVAPWDGVTTDAEGNPAIDTDQLSLAGALSGAISAVQVTTTIPSDTPSAGVIRVQLDDGSYQRVPYSAYNGDTFTVSVTLNGPAALSNNVWIAYIDDEAAAASASFTSVYSANRDLVVRVRDGGASPIKEFITSAVLGSNGGSVTAIRTSDA